MNKLMEWWDRFKVYLTRKHLEIASAGVIALAAILVFLSFIPWPWGTITLDKGNLVYQGSVVHGKMSGNGTLTFKNGDVYKGHFSNGSFDGQGTYTAKAGWVYVGQFKKGQPEGKGKLTTEKNVVYEGTFKQGIYQK